MLRLLRVPEPSRVLGEGVVLDGTGGMCYAVGEGCFDLPAWMLDSEQELQLHTFFKVHISCT